jgi:UDP-N-acetylmuramoyl-tripeptide--D-alanyl-D-alanine ligase
MTLDLATLLSGTEASVLRLGPDGKAEGSLLTSDLVREFSDVSIDSRSVSPGSLFVALPGTRADGHAFVEQALRAGARAALVSRVPEIDTTMWDDPRYLCVVPETLAALQSLATTWRLRQPARVIGITGSIGKTTTKEVLAAVLSARWPVLWSEANLNTEIGLPLMLLRLTNQHRAGIFEMGMYVTGDIELLARIAQPHTGLVTTIAPIHLERMGTIDAIAREKSKLIQALPPDGLAVLNADDPWTRAMAMTSGTANQVLVGLAEGAEYRASGIEPRGLEGLTFTLHAEGGAWTIRTRVPGVHTVHAFLSAAAVARSMGMGWHEVADALAEVRLESRQRMLRLGTDVLLIDDSYNAAPLSVLAALDLLNNGSGTRIAVLGDMLELGPGEEAAHREIGARVAQVADWLVLRGKRVLWTAEEAIALGMDSDRVIRAETNIEAASAVRDIARQRAPVVAASPRMQRPTGATAPGDQRFTILVKGSRGIRMEEIVQDLQREWL